MALDRRGWLVRWWNRTETDQILGFGHARELGRALGGRLEPCKVGLAALEGELESANAKERAELLADKKRIELRIGHVQDHASRIQDRLAELEERARSTLKRKRDQAGDFAWVKALGYIVVALIFVLADFAIVAVVFHYLLGYPWRVEIDLGRGQGVEELNFLQLAFRDPGVALTQFPDLATLTASLVLIPFFIKVWFDVRNPTRLGTIYSWAGVLAGLAILLPALGRVFVDMSQTGARAAAAATPADSTSAVLAWLNNVSITTVVGRTIICALGIAIPVIGALFFVQGYNILVNRIDLMSGAIARVLTASRLHWLARREEKFTRALQLIEELQKGLDDRTQRAFPLLRSEFAVGYGDGVAELLRRREGQPLTERLWRVLLSRLARR